MSNIKPTREILFSYFSYIILFIGSAFVSGAIVHSGNPQELGKYAIIGIIGVSLFVAGQFIQEYIINKNNLKEGGIFKFFMFSLMLSVGIGMISGGTQHFSDFPTYSSYLIPIGFTVSLIAYLLKNNYTINKKLWASIIVMTLLVSVPLFFGLNILANNLNVESAKKKAELCSKSSFSPFAIIALASEGHNQTTCHTNSKISSEGSMTMPMTTNIVKDDKTFIEYVIPHHQDAINSSMIVLGTTKDPELKEFLNKVIKTQGQEITTLKNYFKTWFGNEYMDNGSYKPMMKGTKSGLEADKEYISGMLYHHSGIIDVAKAVIGDPKIQYKPEIITLSKQIIKDQEADNIILNKWLAQKYTKTTQERPAHNENDDHMGH